MRSWATFEVIISALGLRVCVPVRIRTEKLPNWYLERCHYVNVLCVRNVKAKCPCSKPGGPKVRSKLCEEEKSLFLLPRIELRCRCPSRSLIYDITKERTLPLGSYAVKSVVL
jgi:hypothetical protein